MFDRHYCIKTNCDTRKFEIFEENEPVNLCFLRLKGRGNGTFTACVLKTPLPGQIPTSCWRHDFTFATVHATDADVTFYDGPGMHTVKAAKQVYNCTWIALLKHGFVLVKIWLLIACGTGFYAVIHFDAWYCAAFGNVRKLQTCVVRVTNTAFCKEPSRLRHTIQRNVLLPYY